MSYLAIVTWDSDNRPDKFQEYAERTDAEKHVVEYGGFVVSRPVEDWPHWVIDPIAKTITVALQPSPPPPPALLTAEELFEMVKAKGIVSDADRPRPKPD